MYVAYILLFLWFVIGDHCSCFSDDRFQPDTAIFKSDGSDLQYKKNLTLYIVIN